MVKYIIKHSLKKSQILRNSLKLLKEIKLLKMPKIQKLKQQRKVKQYLIIHSRPYQEKQESHQI